MVIFYTKWKKYNEIQMIKNKMDLNNRKMTNHSIIINTKQLKSQFRSHRKKSPSHLWRYLH